MTAELSVLGEVRFSIDGQATHGFVRGEGDRVVVHADDPVGLINATVGAEPGWVVPFLAARLHDGGLTVDLTGPRGTVATLGAGVDSTLGRIVGGTRHLRLVDPLALLPLARARLQLRPALAVAGAVTALVLASRAAYRRRT